MTGNIRICDLDRACDFEDAEKLSSPDSTYRYMAPELFFRDHKWNEKV
jgi:major membrane immunogen (membrane-anchored lipoprotein)